MMQGTLTAWLTAGLLAVVMTAAAGTTRVALEDNGAELTNPEMGWTLYQFDDGLDSYGVRIAPEDLLEDWPGMSTVYMRVPWSVIEPQEGVYCWWILDTPLRRYAQRGLKVGLRFTCTESFYMDGTPEWVQRAGAKGDRFTHDVGLSDKGDRWEPNYDDPVFLAKLENFLKAAAERYDNRDEVAFVDVGTFGIWGEGHTWLGTSKVFSDATIRKHVDLFLKYFKHVPVLGNVGFFSRNGSFRPMPQGDYQTAFTISIPKEWAGKRLEFHAYLRNPYTGNLDPEQGNPDRTVTLGWITFSPEDGGAPQFTPNSELKLPEKLKQSFAIIPTGLGYEPERFRYFCSINATFRFAEAQMPHIRAEYLLVDPESGATVGSGREIPAGGELLEQLAQLPIGFRDDSILVSPLGNAYYNAHIHERFWRRQPIVLEAAHHDLILNQHSWYDGDSLLRAIKDTHASQISIHFWPREFLRDNRELVRKINQCIGYRFQLREAEWEMRSPGEFKGQLTWRNAGVAPCYFELYPTLTLKNAAGGIVGCFPVEDFRLDSLAPDETRTVPFRFALPEIVYLGFPKFRPGDTCDVFISAGTRLGKPAIQLPLDGNDGQNRYKIGSVTVE